MHYTRDQLKRVFWIVIGVLATALRVSWDRNPCREEGGEKRCGQWRFAELFHVVRLRMGHRRLGADWSLRRRVNMTRM